MECDKRGINPRPDLCDKVGVRKYPTWIIRGTRYEGVMTLEEIAKAASFTPEGTPAAAPR